jgi:hypothetical protein
MARLVLVFGPFRPGVFELEIMAGGWWKVVGQLRMLMKVDERTW